MIFLEKIPLTIRDAYCVDTVCTVYTVDMVYTVGMVDTIDMV